MVIIGLYKNTIIIKGYFTYNCAWSISKSHDKLFSLF